MSIKEISTPVDLLRFVFRASFRLVDRAVLIGTIELKSGIKIPIAKAKRTADPEGTIEGM